MRASSLLLLALLIPTVLRAEENELNFILDLLRDGTKSTAEANPSQKMSGLKSASNERYTTLRPVSRSDFDLEVDARRLRKSNQATKRNIGSATILNGDVYVHHIFLGDKTSSWTEFEKDQVKRKLNEAYNFINVYSRQYNKQVRFFDEFATDVTIRSRIPRDAHADPRWTEVVIAMGDDGSAEKTIRRIKTEKNVENAIICLHVNKAALSYNLAYYENVTRCYAAERMVCFTSYPDGRETSAATYAHEILHLFGAGDLYFPYDKTPDRKTEAGRLFPNDVMFRVDYDIFQLNVGKFTAYRIGWEDHLSSDYLHLED